MAELAHAAALAVDPIRRDDLAIASVGLAGQVVLRGEPPALARAVRDVVGCALPETPCTIERGRDAVLWLAPDRWLIASSARPGRALAAALAQALAGAHALVADVTDGLAVLDVTGGGARDLLASACGLDLHPRAFPPDRVARTLAAGADVVLYRTENPDGFRLHVARPVAAHLWDWLAATARDPGR